MKTIKFWIISLLLILLSLSVGLSLAQEKSYHAERFDSVVTVQEGGSLRVQEDIIFNFIGGSFSYVFRELPLDYTDGITIVEASVDGRVYPEGENAGQVEIEYDDPIRVTWHLESTQNSSHTFTLKYRVDGVVRQTEISDSLIWQALPDSYEYSIDESQTLIQYPASATLIADPLLTAGDAQLEQQANQIIYTAKNLSPDSPLVMDLKFESGSLITQPPHWQSQDRAAAAQLPYWLVAAFSILVAGLSGLGFYWQRNRAPVFKPDLPVTRPPSRLAPGLAGALPNLSADWNQAQATLYDLAERGLIFIEELPEQGWMRKNDFSLRLLKPIDQLSGDYLPHEIGLIKLLFTDKDELQDVVKISKVGKRLSGSKWKLYSEAVKEELKQADFLSPDRKRAQNTLYALAFLFFVVATGGMILAAILDIPAGIGPFAVVGAGMLLALISMISGVALKPLSDLGAETAADWDAFKKYLKEITKGKHPIEDPRVFEAYLPYATSFGLLSDWVKYFRKQGLANPPAYFHTLSTSGSDQNWVIFVAMTGAFHSSGASSSSAGVGAGAGAGAAGGGASGAG